MKRPDLEALPENIQQALAVERERQGSSAQLEERLRARLLASVASLERLETDQTVPDPVAPRWPRIARGPVLWTAALGAVTLIGGLAAYPLCGSPEPASEKSPTGASFAPLDTAGSLTPSSRSQPSTPARTDGPAVRLDPQDHACRAVRFLESTQGNFAEHGGGGRSTWEWISGSGQAAPNAAGIVAVAIGRSAVPCGPSHALASFAEERLTVVGAWQAVYDPDIEALALAAEAGDSRYRVAAIEAFRRRYSGASGREIVERWFWLRSNPALVGFDAAQAVRAALAVGEREIAIEIADAMASQVSRWARPNHEGDFLTSARGAMLEVFAALDSRRYLSQRGVVDVRDSLILSQEPDGSWDNGATQATAYAVRGLRHFPDRPSQYASKKGRHWLRSTQRHDGSWSDTGPGNSQGASEVINEVVAEALLALQE